jgi:hypothetical protein
VLQMLLWLDRPPESFVPGLLPSFPELIATNSYARRTIASDIARYALSSGISILVEVSRFTP